MVKKSEDFGEWYNEIVESAGLCDKRYPIKGMNIWTAYGWKVMRLIDSLLRDEMERTKHDEVCFPLLIPEDQFAKEKEHIKGFDSQVYWVTHAGTNQLDIRLCLRPTSETAMYPIFKLWVRSHADLPLKTYQIVNVFRYETKQTRAFMRVREIHFFESHTVHSTFEDAEKQIAEDIDIMDRLSRKLCLPYLASVRPEWDKFAGAHYSVGIDAVMPTGRTLQIGGIHQYRDNFAKPFEISFEDESGGRQFAHQTTYGMSERLVGAVIALHGDDSGVILPPAVAPYQVVIVPVPAKGNQQTVEDECRGLEKRLTSAGIRVHLDLRDLRPGNKYYDWELKGVPLRLELGMRDIEGKSALVVRRDTRQKIKIPLSDIEDGVRKALSEIEGELYHRASEKIRGQMRYIEKLESAGAEDRVYAMHWCGSEECGKAIEKKFDAAVLGTPRKGVTLEDGKKGPGKCACCGKDAPEIVHAARTY